MSSKISVVKNRVTIDDSPYDVKPLAEGKCNVYDDFGVHLGSFIVRGRTPDAEDFGVDGAHPIAQIGKAWIEASVLALAEKKPVAHVCRIAQHEAPGAEALTKATAYLAWLKKQPGVIAAFLTHDAETKKTVSITVWESREKLTAFGDKPPEGAAALAPASVDLLPVLA